MPIGYFSFFNSITKTLSMNGPKKNGTELKRPNRKKE